MAPRPFDQDPEAAMRRLTTDVRRMALHSHPGMVADPDVISGSRSDPAAILEQLLATLSANGIIIDETTD